MGKILITSATKFEIRGIADFINIKLNKNEKYYTAKYNENEISILITGIGSFQTIYNLTKHLNNNKYDFILNIGICGSFNRNIKIGSVVNIIEEQFADFGIDDNGVFTNIFETNLINQNILPFKNGKLINNSKFDTFRQFPNFHNNLQKIKSVKSITLNTVSGEKNKIKQLEKKFNADIENMEGAGFFYVCLLEKIPFAEIRAISNYIEPRNKDNWDIKLAINKLTKNLIRFLETL